MSKITYIPLQLNRNFPFGHAKPVLVDGEIMPVYDSFEDMLLDEPRLITLKYYPSEHIIKVTTNTKKED